MSAANTAGVDAIEPMSSAEAATYQRLRAHLATLKLTAAAVTAASAGMRRSAPSETPTTTHRRKA